MAKKPRIVIIGAGMAGLTAANKLYLASKDLFDLCVVEGGTRIGGRINTTEFCGDRIEMGATWIHGIGGSPIHKISQEINSLVSEQPWEGMDGLSSHPKTVAEGGFEVNPSMVEFVSSLFDSFMDYAQGKLSEDSINGEKVKFYSLAAKAFKSCKSSNSDSGKLSVGRFLKQCLNSYWDCLKDQGGEIKGHGPWSKKLLEEAIFTMNENTLRTYTSAGDVLNLDFTAESEYQMFPDGEITIAKGYKSVIEHLASVLPPGLIQLGRKVSNIEWQPKAEEHSKQMENGINGESGRPVKLHFCDGSTMLADHVIITVSLGVLKAGINRDSGLFSPPLPTSKKEAISRLGYGVVNKLFLQFSHQSHDPKGDNLSQFPSLHMAFHRPDSEFKNKKIPWWMRRISSLCPIYERSSVLLSWFAGEEAVVLESLSEEEIINGVSTTISSFLSQQPHKKVESNCNGNVDLMESSRENSSELKITKVLKSKWGNDPLFLGSYSYVAVGSSGDDLDTMAEPLPKIGNQEESSQIPQLQILFAGEATHRTHYSTTHGAYFSGIREANRLLQHYHSLGA